jgi:predicted nucleic acid-binding protein
MKKVIVDTNILFASLRVKNSKLREIFERQEFNFFTPNFLMVEIFKHKERILHKSKVSEEEVYEILYKMLYKINFVNEESITLGNFIEAYRLCGNIDEKDTPFVALTLELEGELWTKDEILKSGLKKKGFNSFFNENE